MIGNYASCQKGEANAGSSSVRADNRFSAPESSHQQEVDLLKGDVYSLGLTLLCAFYLCQNIDRKLFIAQNKLLESKYDVLKIIESMMAPVEERPSIAQIKAKLAKSTYKYQGMGNLVDSMHHRQRPTPEEAASTKLATGWAYQRLGLWNEWKKEYEEALELEEHNSSSSAKAASFLQLAVIDHCRGQLESRFLIIQVHPTMRKVQLPFTEN
jgi:hypothetical protein